MGLLSDTLEDNRERSGQTEMLERLPIELPPAPPPKVCCPVCDRDFGSDLALNNHIAEEHGRQHLYIKANGRIVRRTQVFNEAVNKCQLILLGLGTLAVTIQAGGSRKRLIIDGNAELLDHLPADYKGEVRVTATHGKVVHRFLMYFGTEPPFDTRVLNREVISLQRSLERGSEPDWSGFQHQQDAIARNELEKMYLDGFLEYSLGFHLDKQGRWKESGEHLETAMQLLQPYTTVLARTAKRVLAIRMNCFSPLERCGRGSVFYPARSFFVDRVMEYPESFTDDSARGEDVVYVDGFTELLLVAIKAFYSRDIRTLTGILLALQEHPLAEDANNEHKLLLVKGRTARIQGDRTETQRTYQRLLYHPLFGREAEEFAKDHGS